MIPFAFRNNTPAGRGLHGPEPTCVPPIPKRPIPIKGGVGYYALTAEDLLRTRIGHSRGDPQIHVSVFDTLYEAEAAMGIEPLMPSYVTSPQSAQHFQDSDEEMNETENNEKENEETSEQQDSKENSEEEDETRPRLRKGTRRDYQLLNTIDIHSSDSSSENDEESQTAVTPEEESDEHGHINNVKESIENLPGRSSSNKNGHRRTAGLTIRSSVSAPNTPEVVSRQPSSTRVRGRPRGRPPGRGRSRQTQRETPPMQPIVISDDELTRSTNGPVHHRQTRQVAAQGHGKNSSRAGRGGRGNGPGARRRGEDTARRSTPTPAPMSRRSVDSRNKLFTRPAGSRNWFT